MLFNHPAENSVPKSYKAVAAAEKAEEPEIKLPTSVGLLKKHEFQKNIYFCFIDYAKALDCVDHHKLENS